MNQPVNRWMRILGTAALILVVAGILLLLTNRKPTNLVRVNKATARLQQAVRKAQAGLDPFINRLANPKPGERFAIKGAFATADGPEYLWVRDPSFRAGVFTGNLDQKPIVYQKAAMGDVVRVAKGQVVDYLIINGDRREGGFTDDALAEN